MLGVGGLFALQHTEFVEWSERSCLLIPNRSTIWGKTRSLYKDEVQAAKREGRGICRHRTSEEVKKALRNAIKKMQASLRIFTHDPAYCAYLEKIMMYSERLYASMCWISEMFVKCKRDDLPKLRRELEELSDNVFTVSDDVLRTEKEAYYAKGTDKWSALDWDVKVLRSKFAQYHEPIVLVKLPRKRTRKMKAKRRRGMYGLSLNELNTRRSERSL